MKYVVSGQSGGDGSIGNPWGVWDDIDYPAVMADDGQITATGTFTDQLRVPDGVATSSSNRLVFFASAAVTNVSLSASFPAAVTRRACLILSDYVTIDGGEWKGADDGAGTGIGIEANFQIAPHIINTECTGNRSDGIFVKSCQGHIVQFNDVHTNGLATVSGKGITAVSADGLNPARGTSGGLVSYNNCYNNVRQGLQVGGSNQSEPSGENVCEYNNVYDNGVGARIEDGRYQVFRNNNIYNNLNADKFAGDPGNALVIADTRGAQFYGNSITDAVAGASVVAFISDGAAFKTNDIELSSNWITRSNAGPLIGTQFNNSIYYNCYIYSNILYHPLSAIGDNLLEQWGEGSEAANQVHNNIFVGGYDGVLSLDNGAKAQYKNNIFSGQTNRHINEDGTGNACVLSNNDYFANVDSDIVTINGSTYTTANISTIDANALQVDPQYTSDTTSDYRPSNTYLIGAGVNVNSSALDFTLGRGYNNPPSMGSYGHRHIGTQNMKIKFNIRDIGGGLSGWNTTPASVAIPSEIFSDGTVVDDGDVVVDGVSFEILTGTSQENSSGVAAWPHTINIGSDAGLADDSADWPQPVPRGVWFTNTATNLVLEVKGLPVGDWDFKLYAGARDESAVRKPKWTVTGDAGGSVVDDTKQQSPMLQSIDARTLSGSVTVTEGGTISITTESVGGLTAPIGGIIIEQVTAPDGSPTLTAPYSDRTDNIGDVIAPTNYESNIAGATSYDSVGFPAGIDTSDLSASGGTLAASGKFTCAVDGSNGDGSVGGQFVWTVNPVESLVSETAVQQVVNGSPFDLRSPDNHNIMSSGPAHNFFGVRFYSDAEGTVEVPITGTADVQIETVEAPLDSIAEEGVTGQRWSMAGNCKSGTITFSGGNVAHYFKVFASQNKT